MQPQQLGCSAAAVDVKKNENAKNSVIAVLECSWKLDRFVYSYCHRDQPKSPKHRQVKYRKFDGSVVVFFHETFVFSHFFFADITD